MSVATESNNRVERVSLALRKVGLTLVGLVFSAAALTALILHLVDPKLKIDTAAVALLFLAALPWLGEILESIDVPGIGGFRFRDRLEKVEERATRLEENVDEVGELGEDALGAYAQSETEAENARSEDGAEAPMTPQPQARSALDIKDLAARYNDIRKTMRPGFERSSAMTRVVQAMEQLAGTLDAFDWRSELTSSDRGMRLAAYAYLHARPEPDAARALIDALLNVEDKPFGQYWALNALQRIAEIDTARAVLVASVPKLERYKQRIGPNTDRARELDELIAAVSQPPEHAHR
jgi:hypothetical protein